MIEEGVTVCPYAVSVFEKYLEKCSYKSLWIVSNRKPPIRIKTLIATFFILSFQLMSAGCSADSYSFYKVSEACDKWSKKGEAFMVIHEWWDNKARGDNTRWCRGDVNNNQILGLELVGLEPGKSYLGKELAKPKASIIFKYELWFQNESLFLNQHLTHLFDRLKGGCVSIQ